MPEIILHYIWQQQISEVYQQFTCDGYPVCVLAVGEHNQGSGPDFLHARVRIDNKEYTGSVEMHTKSSDWYRHRHHLNPAYNEVVLHVVREADREVYNAKGERIPQCVLHYPEGKDYLQSLFTSAMRMDKLEGVMRCYERLRETPSLVTDGWRSLLLQHRLDCRHASIRRLLELTQGDWDQAFYISLARNFGFHTNSNAFERLAMSLPLIYLRKHRNSLHQLTAMLLGQSGLLREETAVGNELTDLWQEYRFMQHKFHLQPIAPTLWKTARLRPQNAPMVRIRQFAQLIFEHEFLFSSLVEAGDIESMRAALTLHPDAVDEDTRVLPPAPIGAASIDVLLINTAIPYRYAYALHRKQADSARAAMALLEAIPAEQNTIIRQWMLAGQAVHSAADTQALIHLYQTYCQPQQCLHCGVGYQVFIDKDNQLRLF